MKTLRQAILGSVLAAILLLIVLSAIGARLGAEDAKALFNAWPMVVFWVLAVGLLVAGFAAFRRLRRLLAAPAGLLMHLGVLLILAGAMWGSIKAHEFREHWFGIKKVPAGYMPIMKGEAQDHLFAADLQAPLGQLPFSLYLRDFWLEHYPSDQQTWGLAVVAATLDEQGNPVQQQEQFAWQVGEEMEVPFTKVGLKVLRYLAHARPAYPPDARPQLVILDAADKKLADLPPEAGAEVALKDPAATVRIVKVFRNLKVMGAGPERRVIDMPGGGQNPALQAQVSRPDAALWEGYVLPQFSTPVSAEPGTPLLTLRYALPHPTGAEEDPASDSPAMQVELACEDRRQVEWLMPAQGEDLVRLSLAPLAGGGTPGHGRMGAMMGPELFLLKPVGPVSAYKSDVEVHQDDRKVASQVIEVNNPLYWGGYHFYQHSYDSRNESCTILSASSDSGLAAVYLGMALLALGAFGRFWAGPCHAFFSPR